MLFNKKLKNYNFGMGTSDNKNPYEAAKSAANAAITQCGQKPTFSIVFTNAGYDQKEILRGINEVLGTNWVGASVDKQIMSTTPYNKDAVVSVFCISTKYMHFGVGVADNYRKNPEKAGKDAVTTAMSEVESDKYVDSFIQFTRAKTKDYSTIVKTPPYFMLTIIGSVYKKDGTYVPGEENAFMHGVIQYTGPHIPVFGLGAGSDFDAFISDATKTTSNFQFANGKVYTNAAVVIFVIANTLFEVDVQHGYEVTDQYVVLTKLDKTGFNILEMNGKPAVDEYCRLIGVKKEDYLKDSFSNSLKNPLGLVALDGATYIKEIYPNPDNTSLHCTYLLKQNMIMNVLKYNPKTLYSTMPDILSDSKKRNKGKKIAFALFCNCCSRRLLLKGDESKANTIVNKSHKDVQWFGCYAFTEIGSTLTNVAQVHGETVTSLIIYDNLLTE